MPFIKQKYPTYESYANLTITDIFSGDALSGAEIFEAKTFSSCYIENAFNKEKAIRVIEILASENGIVGVVAVPGCNSRAP